MWIGEIMIITMKATAFRLKGNFHAGAGARPTITNYPFRRLPSRFEALQTLPGLGLSLDQGMGTHHHPIDYRSPHYELQCCKGDTSKVLALFHLVRAAPVLIAEKSTQLLSQKNECEHLHTKLCGGIYSSLSEKPPPPQRSPSPPPYSPHYSPASSPAPSPSRMENHFPLC